MGREDPKSRLGPSTSVRTSEIKSGGPCYLCTQDGATQVPRAKGMSIASQGLATGCHCLLVPAPTVVHAPRDREGILRLACTSPSAPVTQTCPWYLCVGGKGRQCVPSTSLSACSF